MIPQLIAASAKLKDGTKEHKNVSPPTNGIHVLGSINNREIKHIYYLTIKPSGVSSPFGHKINQNVLVKQYP